MPAKMIPAIDALEIRNDALVNWIAPDGGMILRPGEYRAGYGDDLPNTAANDNSALFRIYFDWLCYKHGVLPSDHGDQFRRMADLFREAGHPGLFLRNPGRVSAERLDDYRAWASGAVLHDHPEIADEICDFGDRHGYIFDVESPEREDLGSWRQGADVAFYQLCATNRPPSIGNLAWLTLGILFQCFQPPRYTSEHLLTLITVNALILKLERDDPAFGWRYRMPVIAGLLWILAIRLWTKGRGIEAVFEMYFADPAHPNRLLSKGVRW